MAAWIAFAVFAAIVIAQMFFPPMGIANNGDFSKVFGIYDLTGPTDDEFRYFVRLWRFDPAAHYTSGFRSTEHLIAGAAVAAGKLFRRDGWFDICVLGAMHVSLYLLAVLSLVPLIRAWVFVLIPIFAGTMYVEWMNTFYMDTAALVFLALAAAFYLRATAWNRKVDRIGFVVAAALFAASKPQHAPLAIPIVGLIFLEPAWKKRRSFRIVAAIAVMAGAAVTWWSRLPDYGVGPSYNVIFMQILPISNTVERDLRELNLEPSYARFIGSFNYEPASPMADPEFARQFGARTSHAKIAEFLLRHPIRTVQIVARALNPAGRQRPLMGDFEHTPGREPLTQSHVFSPWSDLKRRMFDEHGSRLLIYGIAVCTTLLIVVWRTRYRWAGACLASMAVLAMLIATLGDALETTRHAFLMNVLLDYVFTAILFAGLRTFRDRSGGTKSPAG